MRALALFSGGLDSMLAIKTIKNQGIDVIALHFDIGFEKESKRERLKKLSEDIDTPLEIVDIKEQFFKDVLFSPRFGYGKNFNPCIDCHGNMFYVASLMLEKYGASFLISGEVVGQRPMSQRKEALNQVERLSKVEGLVLRPLSAKLLKETIPEINGWVDRERLHDFRGRGRKRQIELAEEFGISDFNTPSGGCLLTEEYISQKIEDFSIEERLTPGEIPFITTGRYFKLPEGGRFALCRNEEENEKIKKTVSERIEILEFDDIIGPVGAITKDASMDDTKLALSILLTYSKTERRDYLLQCCGKEFCVSPLPSKEAAQQYILRG